MATVATRERVVVLKRTEEYDVLRVFLESTTKCVLCGQTLESKQQAVILSSHETPVKVCFCNKACFKAAEKKARNRHRQSAKKSKKSTLFIILEGLS